MAQDLKRRCASSRSCHATGVSDANFSVSSQMPLCGDAIIRSFVTRQLNKNSALLFRTACVRTCSISVSSSPYGSQYSTYKSIIDLAAADALLLLLSRLIGASALDVAVDVDLLGDVALLRRFGNGGGYNNKRCKPTLIDDASLDARLTD